MVNFINITIFSVEALPWNLIVQDHWRWGLSTDHIVGRVWLSCHLEWGVCFVSKQLASTSFRRQVQRWRGLSGNVRLSNLLISSCWSFLSNTKNGANFNLPAPYGRIAIHEKLSASGRRGGGGGEANPWQGLCPWITLGSPPLSPQLWDLWLDDTGKNVGSNLPLLFKLHKIWSVDSQENH